jgi:hypothetical protein
LLVNNLLQHIELLVDLLVDFVLQRLLVEDALLHVGALLEVGGAHVEDVLEQVDLLGGGLLQGQSSAPLCLFFEIAVIAKSSIVSAGVNLEFLLVLAELNAFLLGQNSVRGLNGTYGLTGEVEEIGVRGVHLN